MDTRQRGRQTKQWKDMSAGEKAKGIITLVVIIFIVVFVVKLVSGGGGDSTNNAATTQATDTSPAQSSQPSVPQQVATWYNQYGYIVQTFGNDSGKAATDAQNGDAAAVSADCEQLWSDVKKAQSFPAIPDPQTASDFSSAMSYYSVGALDCINGENNVDPSLINMAAQEFTQGNTQLEVAANDIKNLATN